MFLLLGVTPDCSHIFHKIYHFNHCGEYCPGALSTAIIGLHYHLTLWPIVVITLLGNLSVVEQSFSIYSAHSPWQLLIYFLSPKICMF